MDVLYFLKDRTKFIRYFYETASASFREIICKIEASEPPFEDLLCDEDGEPPFLEEWSEADTGLEVLGRLCVSMLSASLKLYFQTLEDKLRITWDSGERERVFKKGLLPGYQACFGQVLDLSWDSCPADLELLEQVVLARNREQHPERITSMTIYHAASDQKKYPHTFFISDFDRKAHSQGSTFMPPAISVSPEQLFQAIEAVEALAEWLEEQIAVAKGR